MVKLGNKARDTMTGFEGIVVAITKWLYGCNRICVEPTKLDKDGNPSEGRWFDEQRIEVVRPTKPKVSKDNTAKTGGPQRDPSRIL